MFVGVSAAAVESVGAWDVPGSNPAADVTLGRGGLATSEPPSGFKFLIITLA